MTNVCREWLIVACSCASHLKDPHFATAIAEKPASPGKPAVAQADIDQAVKEYQERQKAKEEKQKEASKSGDGTDNDKDKTKDASKKDSSVKSWAMWLMEGSSAASAKEDQTPAETTTEPTQFELRQDFFNMRLRLHQQKKYAKDAAARQAQLNFPSIPQLPPTASTASRPG